MDLQQKIEGIESAMEVIPLSIEIILEDENGGTTRKQVTRSCSVLKRMKIGYTGMEKKTHFFFHAF